MEVNIMRKQLIRSDSIEEIKEMLKRIEYI